MSSTPTGSDGVSVFQSSRPPVMRSTRKTSTAGGRTPRRHRPYRRIGRRDSIAAGNHQASAPEWAEPRSALNRKEHPRDAVAAEDGVVVAHCGFACENHAVRGDRTREAGGDLLNVASGLALSWVACEDNALRVAEPSASPNRARLPLGSVTVEPAPVGRRIRFPPRSASTHRPSGDSATPLASPSGTAGEPSMLRRNNRRRSRGRRRSIRPRKSASGRRVTVR